MGSCTQDLQSPSVIWICKSSYYPPVCCGREACLRQEGFEDVFKSVKTEENEKALALLPAVLRYFMCYSATAL